MRLQEVVEWGAVCGWHHIVEVEGSRGGGGVEVELTQKQQGGGNASMVVQEGA